MKAMNSRTLYPGLGATAVVVLLYWWYGIKKDVELPQAIPASQLSELAELGARIE